MSKSSDMLGQLYETLGEVLTQRQDAIEKLDEWAKTIGDHHGEDIPWEAVDDLWRTTNDVLTQFAKDL